MNDKDKDESLLKNSIGENFFLNRDFDFNTSGMGFCPNECSIDESDFL